MAGPRLLIRLGSLGDVVLATAAATAAREAWGDGAVDVLVKEEWAPLWEGHPAVRRVHAWPRRDRGASGLRSWASRLRGEGYVETFDLQGSPRTRILASGAGLRRIRRPRRYNMRRRLLVTTGWGGPPAAHRVVQAFVEAVVPGAQAAPTLYPGEEARARAAQLLPGEGPRIGLVPGARHATKRWPLERFVEAGRRWAGEGRGPVPVFFGPDEQELLEAARVRWPDPEAWFPVRADLMTVAACFGRLAAVATNDTGLMHVAAAMGTPVVALFGPTVRSFGFAPTGPGHRLVEVEDLSCRPCSVHGGPRCPRGHFRCMLDIDAERVVDALAATSRGATQGQAATS